MDENGNHTTGITAAQNLRREKNKWAVDLTEDVFREVYQKNHQINSEQLNDSIEEEDKAFQKKQGISSIIDIINDANSPWRDENITTVSKVIIPAYAIISLLLLPVIYQFYKKAEIK